MVWIIHILSFHRWSLYSRNYILVYILVILFWRKKIMNAANFYSGINAASFFVSLAKRRHSKQADIGLLPPWFWLESSSGRQITFFSMTSSSRVNSFWYHLTKKTKNTLSYLQSSTSKFSPWKDSVGILREDCLESHLFSHLDSNRDISTVFCALASVLTSHLHSNLLA